MAPRDVTRDMPRDVRQRGGNVSDATHICFLNRLKIHD